MAKRSQRRGGAHHERGQSGCMSGFIGIFDFRQSRSTRKLLSDKRHGSSRHAAGTRSIGSRPKSLSTFDKKHQGSDADVNNFSDSDENEMLRSSISKTSVKKLIEEDMSNEQEKEKQNPSIIMENINADPDYKGNIGKKHKQINKICKVASEIHVQDSHLDIAALMEEFCIQIHQRQDIRLHNESEGDSCGVWECSELEKYNHLDDFDTHLVKKHSILQKKLSEAAEDFLSKKLIEAKQLTADGAIHHSRQCIDALDILNSNKELLLKLLQDSNALLVKHIQDLQDTASEKDKQIGISRQVEELCRKEVQKHNIQNFRKRDKSQKRNSSKESDDPQVSNRIVVLKPKATSTQNSATANSPSSSPQPHYRMRYQGWSGRFNSQFSLGEIKRKLKNSIGESRKEQHSISMDGVLHKTPRKHQISGNSDIVDGKNIAKRELPSKPHLQSERKNGSSTRGGEVENVEKSSPHYLSTAQEAASVSVASSKSLTMTTAGYPKRGELDIYIEAKKHLEEIFTGTDKDGGFSYRQNPKTLGKILSLPEYTLTPLCSPQRDGEDGFVTAQMRFSSNGSFRTINENIWRFKPDYSPNNPSPLRKSLEIQEWAADGAGSDIKLQEFDSHPESSEELLLDNNSSHLSPSRKCLEIQEEAAAAAADGSDIKLQEFESNPDSSDKLLPDIEAHGSIYSLKEESIPKGDVGIPEETDVDSLERDNLSGPSKPNSSTLVDSTTEIWEEEGSSNCLRQDTPQDDFPPSFSLSLVSSSPLLLQKVEYLGNINDPPERPSPISVLEPLFEDVSSPTTTRPKAELQAQQVHFRIEEDDCSTMVVTTLDKHNYQRPCMEDKNPSFEYVTSVLQVSNLNWDELLGKYHSSELLLSQSLFDELEVVSSQLCGDKKLLFDCINEILGGLCDRYFGSSPWVAFVCPDIRPVPVGKSIKHEVWEDISWNLLPQPMPRSLDQIIGKDLEKGRSWMDLRPDAEVIGTEMVDTILEELMEDTIFDLRS